MKVTLENLPRRQVLLNIEAEPAELEESKKVAYKKLVQRVRIPGFRKGKAPMAMLERHIGKAALLEEAINELVPDITNQAIKENDIDATGLPEIEISSKDPLSWMAKVDLAPKVDLGNYSKLRVSQEPIKVTAKELKQVVEEIRVTQAPWEPTDEPAKFGNLITIDVKVEESGNVIADDTGLEYNLAEDNLAPVPGFGKELIGVKGGDTRTFSLTFPDDHERPELANKNYSFTVKTLGVKSKNLAPLDDDFAKSLDNGFDTLKSLKQHLTEQIKAAKNQEAVNALHEKAIQLLVETSIIDYPPSLVEHEANHILEDQARRLSQSQDGLENYLGTIGKSKEEMLEDIKPSAQERVERSLVLTELKIKEGIEVNGDEIDQEVNRLAQGEQSDQLRELFGSESGRQSLERTLLTRKTLERLGEIVTSPGARTKSAKGATRRSKVR